MKIRRFGTATAVASIAALTLVACGNSDNDTKNSDPSSGAEAAVSGQLTGGGASSQESAMTAWSEGIKGSSPEFSVLYDPVGSGAGREGFLNGQYSFTGSDAAMDADEQKQAEDVCGTEGVFHVPAYISPIAVAFNLEGIDSINMDAETIAEVFNGKITKWNDEKIASQNEGVELPDKKITVVHRADDSGTTENFTDYLNGAAKEAWAYDVVESWPSEITAESAQQTSGVVSLTSDTDGAITYADASQIGDLSTVAVGVGDEYVEYSPEAAAKAVETAEKNEESEGAVTLDRTTEESGVYPIVLVSYHIYCKQYADEDLVNQVKAFGSYVVSEEGQQAAADSAGNAPISEAVREEAQERLDAITAQG